MIVMGTMPMIFVAAMVEGFLTRHAQHHTTVVMLFIALSLAYIIYYYIYLPWRVRRNL